MLKSGLKFIQILAVTLLSFQLSAKAPPKPAIENPSVYLPLLKEKRVGVIANHTSRFESGKHLVDFLIEEKIAVTKIFAPEHGFRGEAAAGETIKDGKDVKTGLPIISLYGNNKKPITEQLKDLDILIFDIQDVGVRFYTYISTLGLVLEAAAENNLPVVILDRPNPLGWYVDGPVLDMAFSSFVGMYPIPVVHGLTVAELAIMMNVEGFLANKVKPEIKVIKALNYTHKSRYALPIAPSPNLPNEQSIILYPSLCFFEATPVSVGRGTDFPFQVIGAPWVKSESGFSFVPKSVSAAPAPKFKDETCHGYDLRDFAHYYLHDEPRIYLTWLIEMYQQYPKSKDKFFSSFMDKLAGTDKLRKQIEAGWSEEKIRESWQADLEKYKAMRKKYLLYPDFE